MGQIRDTKHIQIAKTALLIAFSLFTLNCAVSNRFSETNNSASSGDGSSTTSNVYAGAITELNIDNNSEVNIKFDSLSDEENIMLILYSHSDTTQAEGFQLGDSDQSQSNNYLIAESDEDITEDFHHMLRQWEEDIDDNAKPASQNTNLHFATIGSNKLFNVMSSTSSSSSYQTVTATLRYSTTHFDFYVDVRNEDAIDDEDLEELADNFLVEDERDLFGDESDVDNNGKFAVLFSQAINELGSSSGGIITGFFYAIDLFDSSVYEASNEMEVYYTLVPDPEGDFGSTLSKSFCMSNIYPTVLPHEFQHMISFNQHYFINGGGSEESWLNEAMSHLAEDIINIDSHGYMSETSLENPARVSSFLSNIDGLCLSCGTSLSQRGGSYLFVRYLYEQAELGKFNDLADGAELITALLDTSETGVDNLKTTLFGDDATDAEFQDIVGKYSLAIYFSNTGVLTSSDYNFTGINLRATQDDNRNTTLNGPAISNINNLTYTNTLSGISFTYLNISGETINDNGGTLTLTLSADAEFGGHVIRE